MLKIFGLVLWMMFPVFAFAGLQVAQVEAISGKAVALSADGKTRILEKSSLLYEADRINTKKDARLKFRMTDGTEITLGERTAFTIKNYRYEANNPENNVLFEMSKGVFRAVSGLITKNRFQKFEVDTPTGTIGIRGTDFWGGFLFSKGLDVVMLEGTLVYVKNSQGETLLQQPGEGTTVMPNTAPMVSKKWPEKKLNKAKASIAF